MNNLAARVATKLEARAATVALRARALRVLIVTDAWSPQINGVVTTLRNTIRELEALGHTVGTITPESFRTLPCPTYPDIRLAVLPGRRVARMIEDFAPDAVHIATEAPLGMAARRHCLRTGRPFTTAYHTQFPEYIHARSPLPLAWSYAVMRWFHAPSSAVMVATPDMEQRLAQRGIANLARWTRGVDTTLFRPAEREEFPGQRPIFVYVGRVAVEKNIEAFLALDLPGTKWVVGDGPARADLERRFPSAKFVGMKSGAELAWHYGQADVFVFPSRTDTFGLVLIEAMACGTPVAAYPVVGPVDVVKDARAGILHEDLAVAAMAALKLDRDFVRRYGEGFSWQGATVQFVANLHPVNDLQALPTAPQPIR
jgi:glycosyltransferase involved in cell wall biosynthesis